MTDYREVKQCDICKCLYTVAELEKIFTGRTTYTCRKCLAKGRKESDKFMNRKNGKGGR